MASSNPSESDSSDSSVSSEPASSSSESGSSSKSSCNKDQPAKPPIKGQNKTHRVVDNSDDKATARTSSDVLIVLQLLSRDLEAVSAGTGIVENLLLFIPGHVFNLDFVVVCTHAEDRDEESGRYESSRPQVMVAGGKLKAAEEEIFCLATAFNPNKASQFGRQSRLAFEPGRSQDRVSSRLTDMRCSVTEEAIEV